MKRINGEEPPFESMDPMEVPSYFSPEQREALLRIRAACMPRIQHQDRHGKAMIWGTGGELPSSTTYTYSVSKSQFEDLFQNPESYAIPPAPPTD